MNERLVNLHISRNGNICPFCDSDQIEGGDFDVANGYTKQRMNCLECDKSWSDIYKLVDVKEAT